RPQPWACDIGVRKKPSAERGPNASAEIRQPQIAITTGVRQVITREDIRRVGTGPEDVAGEEAAAAGVHVATAGRADCSIDIRILLGLGPGGRPQSSPECDRPVCHKLTNTYRTVTKSTGELMAR